MKKWILILFLAHWFVSCSFFKPEVKSNAIARVEDSYLYEDVIKDLVPKGTSKNDSILIVRNYINRWASQKLLVDAAEINLNEETKSTFNQLIRQYKIDLYTKAYIEEIVKRSVDTVVSNQELVKYYIENKENFKTNEKLVRLRYINLQKENPKFESIKSKFFDFKKSENKFWETNTLQFKSFALNDSVWVEMNQIYSKLPFINPENRDNYITSGKKIQFSDSLDMYFVKINKVIGKNEISPFEYLKPTLKEVILNKRKLELIKKFEKEITEDAIKDKKYEIYK